MFKRYAPPSRRAIFYAREDALHTGSAVINPTHILAGLLVEETSRANVLFHLGERFPEETARMRTLKKFPESKTGDTPLANDAKRVVAYAAEEANRLNNYWIDTDHLVLGILRDRDGSGAATLNKVGLQIDPSREIVAAHRASREAYGPVPALWFLEKPISRINKWAAFLYLFGVVCLFQTLAEKNCASSFFPRR